MDEQAIRDIESKIQSTAGRFNMDVDEMSMPFRARDVLNLISEVRRLDAQNKVYEERLSWAIKTLKMFNLLDEQTGG